MIDSVIIVNNAKLLKIIVIRPTQTDLQDRQHQEFICLAVAHWKAKIVKLVGQEKDHLQIKIITKHVQSAISDFDEKGCQIKI